MNAADLFMNKLYDETVQRLRVERALEEGEPFDEWQSKLRAEVEASLGAQPKGVPLNVREHSRKHMDGYTRVKLYYQSEAGYETPAYLLIPDGLKAPAPAVVACTGHCYGARDIVGINADFTDRPETEAGYQKNFALKLMRRGFIVIAPEPLAFGELMLEGDDGNSCKRIGYNMLIMGRTLTGARIRQLMCAVKLLSDMPEVDNTRIGAMGISGGGLLVAFLAMLDARIKAVVVSGYACMYKRSIYAMFHCVDNFPPNLLNIAENDDLMCLITPRPMLWESGDKDSIFPRAGVKEAEINVRRAYAAQNAEANFAVDYFEGVHEISGKLAYDFLSKHLSARAN